MINNDAIYLEYIFSSKSFEIFHQKGFQFFCWALYMELCGIKLFFAPIKKLPHNIADLKRRRKKCTVWMTQNCQIYCKSRHPSPVYDIIPSNIGLKLNVFYHRSTGQTKKKWMKIWGCLLQHRNVYLNQQMNENKLFMIEIKRRLDGRSHSICCK